MKKGILTCTFLFAGIIAFAQIPTFNLGVKAGMNLAKLSTDFASEQNRLGFQAGAWARFGSGLYIQPEIYLGTKNNELSFNDQGNQVEGKAKFTTLDVPLLLGSRIGAKNLNARFMAGPVISFIVDKNTTFHSATAQLGDYKNYKNQTWGGQFGAGVDLGSLSVDLRYEAGFTNISKSPKYDQKQNLWHLSVGFKII